MMDNRGNWIGGRWALGKGDSFESINPADQSVLWHGIESSADVVDEAFQSARRATAAWSRLSVEDRAACCRRFAESVQVRSDDFARLISQETGKPFWESRTEVAAVVGKIELSITAQQERRSHSEMEMPGARAVTRYKPHGVLGVLGPFNLPAHLPNGHIVPALLAGNTVVFKPSELTPAIGQFMIEMWDHAKLPEGVVNLVQGGRDTGAALVKHPQLDGLLFTGSSNAGTHFLKVFADQPEKMLALEMGGNNPLIVHETADLDAAAYQTVLSAFITAGQRCTCARRLIVVDDAGCAPFLERLVAMMQRVRVGIYTDDPEPFMGTLINVATAERMREAVETLTNRGGTLLAESSTDSRSAAIMGPCLIDVTNISDREDHEWFGPLLQVVRVADFDAAIEEANRTSYGLSAGLLSDRRDLYDEFVHRIRAGVVNWNRQTTGASGKLPFGGIGRSGNHRPSGYFATDYCSYAVASLESETLTTPAQVMTGIDW